MNNVDKKQVKVNSIIQSGGELDNSSVGVGMGIASVLCCSIMISLFAAGGGGGYYLYKNKK